MKANQEPNLGRLSLANQILPPRPGYGTQGQKIILRTNYFKLVPDSEVKIYRYSIDITPAAVSRKRRQIIALLLATPTFSSIGFGVATDYSNFIVTAQELDLGGNGYLEESVLYRHELEPTPHLNATVYNVKLSPIGLAQVTELLASLSSPPSHDVPQLEKMAETISAMNLGVTQNPNTSPTVVSGSNNRKFFPLDCGWKDLGGGLIAVRGYYCSVRGFTARILVNINVCTSAFYPNINLRALIDLFNTSHSRESLQEFLKGLRVKTNHIKDSNGPPRTRVYAIQRLAGDTNDTRFEFTEPGLAGEISVKTYFMNSRCFPGSIIHRKAKNP